MIVAVYLHVDVLWLYLLQVAIALYLDFDSNFRNIMSEWIKGFDPFFAGSSGLLYE